MIGKRKRETRVVPRHKGQANVHDEQSSSTINPDNVFRKHFEAMFAPLPEQQTSAEVDTIVDDDSTADSDVESGVSEWSGLSTLGDRPPVVEVVDYTIAENVDKDDFHRARQKAFMSSRPPNDAETTNRVKQAKEPEEADHTEKLNLKHDLDLQRLLKESHLLEKSKASTAPGKERQQALDMRLQALGAKPSMFTQQKMPVAHRVGITKKADQQEARRRRDAKESGVILEKAIKKGSKNTRRERGVDVPAVGKFSGGTLKLSRWDIAGIQGPPTAAKRKGKRR